MTVTVARGQGEFGDIVCRMLRVEQVRFNRLFKRVYYGGLALLAGFSLVWMLQFAGMALEHPGEGSVGLFIVAAFVGFGTAAWRLGCELVLAVLLALSL